jgi:hypothetical protein
VLELAFQLVTGAALVAVAAWLVHVRPGLGVGALFAVLAATSNLRTPLLTAAIDLAGFQLAPLDLVCAVLFCAAIGRTLADLRSRRLRAGLVLLLVLLLAVNSLRGAASYEVPLVAIEARPWFYLLTSALFAVTGPVPGPRWQRMLRVYCGWLVVAAIAGFAATGIASVSTRVQVNGTAVDPRPVTAAGALVLLTGLVLLLGPGAGRRAYRLPALAVLAVTLVLLQHRTLWVTGLAALMVVAVARVRAGGRPLASVVLGSGSVGVLVLVGLLTGEVQRSAVVSSAGNAVSSENSLAWRVSGWHELLRGHLDPPRLLFGDPFGAGYLRTIDGQQVGFSPHSQYVEVLLRFGAVGLACCLLFVVVAWRGAARSGPALGVDPVLVRALLVAFVLYGITYRWDPFVGIVLGTLVAARSISPAGAPARAHLPSVPRDGALAAAAIR